MQTQDGGGGEGEAEAGMGGDPGVGRKLGQRGRFASLAGRMWSYPN